ncbi:MAG: DUF814 domain-containing protein [Bacteroidetes bacterium]|nr:DUF814 domain-containing protein [Bacteroidota bacterium]
MITNYYTLFHLANEFNRDFSGKIIDEIFTQYKGELAISFRDIPSAILIGCEPADNYIYARKEFARARRNTVNVFSRAHESAISKISMHPADRQICIQLNDGYNLFVNLFGSNANVFYTDSKGAVSDVFLKKKDISTLSNESFEIQNPDIPKTPPDKILALHKNVTIAAALKSVFSHFGNVMIKELLFRAGLSSAQLTCELQQAEIDRLMNLALRMKEEFSSAPLPRIYLDGTMPVRFSLHPLEHLREYEFQEYKTVSEAVLSFRARLRREKNMHHEKEEIIKLLKHESGKIDRTLQKISAESDELDKAEKCEKFGKLLISQVHLLKKGDTSALAEDFIEQPGNIVEIPLDPHLTPAKNAERYFEKADKLQRGAEENRQRRIDFTEKQKLISQLLLRMDDIVTESDLCFFIEENQNNLLKFGIRSKKAGHAKKEIAVPFRVFKVAGGFQVWAGKSGENNDLLSTRHTAKNDLWFHARGVGGSHVVLKIGTGKGEVSRQAIEEAAGIAAYYSKMKNSKLVPVSMCEGKYVRKPKGVPAGTVTLEREKTIFVQPALPAK